MERKSKIDIDEALQPTHESARRMGDQTHFPTVDKQVALAEGAAAVEETMPPGYDKYYLSPEELRDLGVDPDTEEHVWVRGGSYWESKEGVDRGLQFKRENIGGRIVLKDGEPVLMEDLMLAVRSRKAADIVERRNQEAMAEYVEAMNERNRDFDKTDVDRLERIRADTQETAYRMGWYGEGSPTHRKSLAQVYDEYSKEEILKEEARWRSHGRSRADSMGPEEQAAREERVAANRQGKTFGGFQKAAFLKGPKGAK